MILAFTLTMPGAPSWNGKWSREGQLHAMTRTVKSTELKEGRYTHQWPDGWCAAITVCEIGAQKARSIRRASRGFLGYEWMVDNLLDHGTCYDKETP